MGIVEKKMETTIMGYIGFRVSGFTWTLQCSSFLGLVRFFGYESYQDYQKGITLEGLGRHPSSTLLPFLIWGLLIKADWSLGNLETV